MTVLPLFDEPEIVTEPSPLCVYIAQPCRKKGRATYGPPEQLDGCVNRAICCLTCGATGVESERTR